MNEAKEVVILKTKLDSPLFTVGIPTYKRAKLLVQAVQSCLNQDFPHSFEIMVLDNNPERNDDTELLMNHYCDYGQISYYKNIENIGSTNNHNKLFTLARGKYVVILHDDDMLYPSYMRVFFSLLEETNYHFELIYPSYSISKERAFPNADIPKELIYRIFRREDYIVSQWGLPSGMMILKDKFSSTGGFVDDFYPISDQEFIYRSLRYLNGCVVYYPLVLYCIGDNESLLPEIQIQGIIKAKEFNHLIRKDKYNKWHFFAYLSYRTQINNLLLWQSNYNSSTANIAKDKIGFRDNILKDKISLYFVKLLKKFLNRIRIHRFVVK